MLEGLIGFADPDAGLPLAGFLSTAKDYLLIFIGFSLVIFFHELGHFIAAKWCNVRVERFAIGFGRELFGLTRGETRYSFNALPLGGYVKMLGQEDFAIDKSGELRVKDDPRAFTHQPTGRRMIIVSAGVIMNLLFAAVVFMLVFMIGVDFPPAEIGLIQPESPAERAGMRLGDRITEVNGKEIADYGDLRPAIMLSDPDEPLVIVLERPDPDGGPASREVVELRPEKDFDDNILRIGIAPPMNNTVSYLWEDPRLRPEEQLKPGDKIVQVNGKEVSSLYEIYPALIRGKGEWVDLTVRRPVTEGASEFKELHLKRRAKLAFRPTTGDPYRDGGHLLGLVPRRIVTAVSPGGRADLAGIKAGDVIVRWGPHYAPTIAEILDSIAANPETDIRGTVLRRSLEGRWTEVSLYVRPKPSGVFRRGKPKVGMDPFAQEHDHLVVADVVTNVTDDIKTPVAHLSSTMPRGSLITKLNDEPVTTWNELTERFIELAGSEVKLTWRYQDQPEQSATIRVPHTLGTTFHLPPGQAITRIDGQRRIEIVREGKAVVLSAHHWIGASEILKKCVGRKVEVEYREILGGTLHTAEVEVTEEMLDTWVMRVAYHAYDLVTLMNMEPVREANPLKAMMIGVRKTYQFIEQIYLMMRRMIITRSVGLEQVSGPVGIFQMGSEVAREDFVKLMYFLALISANLAVINFLPLPIVDGGLFIFLIVEKIKGSPISMRIQIATQLIGLALIIGIFLFVTINDIHKIFG